MKNTLIKYTIAGVMASVSTFAHAQFHQQIAVDGKYIPEIIRIDRINTYPAAQRFQLDTKSLNYETKGVPAAFSPRLISMEATGWRDSHIFDHSRGYVDFGLGSWLNSTLSAGYRFIDSDNSTLGIRLQHNSISLWKPNLSVASRDVKQWRYDESLGLYGSHKFNGYGRLSASAGWHFGYFDYYGYNPVNYNSATTVLKAPEQILNDAAARIGWESIFAEDAIAWNASAGIRYFGYRSACAYGAPASRPETGGSRESDINIEAGVKFPTSSKSAVGIDLDSHILCYGGYSETTIFSYERPDNYGIVTLTPYYRFVIDRFNLKIGAALDFAIHAGAETNRYGAFHMAPDVAIDYDGGAARLFLHMAGGSNLHTLASGYDLDYYQNPILASTRPTYSPLDGDFGVTFGPFGGFSAGARFAFRLSRGEYLGGWYMTSLNYGANPSPKLPAYGLTSNSPMTYSYSPAETINMHGWSTGLNLSYDFGNILKLEANGDYQPQHGETGYFNGYDRARWTADLSATSTPINRLNLKLSYNYRGVRRIYTYGQSLNDKNIPESTLCSMRLPDITMLNFGASYGITDKFSIWAQGDNLLNRHDEKLPCLPLQGITLTGGVSIIF